MSVSQATQNLLSADILHNLHHKNQERKEMAYQALVSKITAGITKLQLRPAERIIVYFTENYFEHPLVSHRRIGIELFLEIIKSIKDHNQQMEILMTSILTPILEHFNDSDPKIRYLSIRAIYTISKEVDSRLIFKHFVQIFDELITKMADLDLEIIKAAVELNCSLESLLVNCLTSSNNFRLKLLVSIIAEKIKSPNSTVRMYLLQWINTLNEMDNLNIIPYLPLLLKDLLLMLGDKEKEVKNKAQQTIKNYVDVIEQLNIDNQLQKVLSAREFEEILMILIELNMGKTSSHTKRATIAFFEQLIRFVIRHLDPQDPFPLKKLILSNLHQILRCIFISLGHDQEEVRKATMLTNEQLLIAVSRLKGEKDIDLGQLMNLLNDMLQENKITLISECVLQWTKFVLENYGHEVLPCISNTIVSLIRKICESYSHNVLSLIESVSIKQEYFDQVISHLLTVLCARNDDNIEPILNKLCNVLNVERIFVSLSNQLVRMDNINFIGQVVYALNSILVTYENTLALRKKLRQLEVSENKELFLTLFRAFSYNPVCALSLSFLAEEYKLSSLILLEYFGEVELSSQTIIELCKVVNLLESPNFIYMRMHLLEKETYPDLLQSMFLLLMLLPQNKIYNMLKARLDTAIQTRKKAPSTLCRGDLDHREILQDFHLVASKIKN